MDLKPLLPPSSSLIHPHHHLEASVVSRFIVTVAFLIGNALTLVPASTLRRDSPTFRALTLSTMLAFASAFLSLLMDSYKKLGLVARICRWCSVVAMAAVLGLLLYVSAPFNGEAQNPASSKELTGGPTPIHPEYDPRE